MAPADKTVFVDKLMILHVGPTLHGGFHNEIEFMHKQGLKLYNIIFLLNIFILAFFIFVSSHMT